jgi:small subunit ribosomal protein S18
MAEEERNEEKDVPEAAPADADSASKPETEIKQDAVEQADTSKTEVEAASKTETESGADGESDSPVQASEETSTKPKSDTGPPSRGPDSRKQGGPQNRGRGRSGYQSQGGRPRRGYFRRKVCRLCVGKINSVDYKDVDMLRRFVTERGKIMPRRMTGTCAKHQRIVSAAVKRARMVALLPYVSK